MGVAIADLVAPGIPAIQPYEPGKPIEEVERELGSALPPGGAIKLASNENPLGPSPRALEAARAALARVHLYPDGGGFYLRRRLAEKLGLSPTEIAIGNGSNELLDLLIRTFSVPGDEILGPSHTFACYKLSTLAHGARWREVPRGPGFAYDLDALVDAVTPRTRIVFLANPDNPTGVHVDRAAMERLLRRLPERVILCVDEAYTEFARAADIADCVALRAERETLVVLRTFSKIYGLAGLRCGYAVAPAAIVDYLNRVRTPFNVNAIAQIAATAALDDAAHVARSQALVREGMPQIEEGLFRLGVGFVPSQGNFVLVDVAPLDGRGLFNAMLHKGVIVRPMNAYGLPHHIRVTIGTPDENRRFLTALEEAMDAARSAKAT